ncbi:hypothetical protein FH972_007169 [Carpinus fangiana]|uniref:Uncharacterized protein n=1 Tax=Carpinus fangiana TaxID=176857 RepID=A0A5N6QWW7_9ROSI|nr:hypothetical protein FH972_007169 [Carpinus fangiana]
MFLEVVLNRGKQSNLSQVPKCKWANGLCTKREIHKANKLGSEERDKTHMVK